MTRFGAVVMFSKITFDVDVNRVLAGLPQDGVSIQLDRAYARKSSGSFYGGLAVEVVAGEVQGLQHSAVQRVCVNVCVTG
jgi:hypothetical protein